MIVFKIKLAIRNLLKNKLYSALIIGGFSIGFTACILIGLFYNSEHNVNTDFPHYKNIYRVYDVKLHKFNLDYKLNQVFKSDYPEVANACPMEYTSSFKITIKDAESNAYTRVDQILGTTNSFFQIFSIDVLESLADKPFSSTNSVVITESVAKKLFGDKDPLGRTIKNEFFSGVVSAVIKDVPENSSFKLQLLLNSENKAFQMSQECNNGKCIYPTNHIVQLNNSADANQFAIELNRTIKEYNSNADSLALQKLSDIYLSTLKLKDAHKKGNSRMLIVFLSIAILILILSSINYLNYTISIQYAKLKEIGINKTSGAGRGELILDSLIEVFLGVVISLIIATILTAALLPSTGMLFGRRFYLDDVNFLQLAPVFLGAVVAIVLLNSLAPIYVLSRFNIAEFLAGGRRGKAKQVGKQVMLTFQLAVSIALIAAVMMIFKQLQYVKHYNLGFNEDHLVRFELPYKYKNPQLIKSEIEKLPFVTSSALSNGYPGWIMMRMGNGLRGDNKFTVNCIYVGDDYLKTMGIHLLKGRDFLPGDKKKACLMNQEAIKRYEWEDLKDKKFNNGGGYQVIGEVNDFNVKSLYSSMEPLALIYDPDHVLGTLSLRLLPGDVGQQMKQIRKVWKELLPEEPMEFTFYDAQFQAMYSKDEKLAKSVTFFSFIAIVLTCMGILGQIFLISINRTKEIGVRKVNGAKVSEILVLLNKDFVIWVVIAFIISSPIAWYAMNKWLQNFAYKTTMSWWIFALAGLLALGIALLTVSFQSWKAATRNPVEALRYE